MPDKLTDSEITVKALKEICELMLSDGNLQRVSTISHTIDLINRLQDKNKAYKYYYDECLKDLKKANTEIERLEKDSKRLKKVEMQLDDAMKMYDTIKAEAYKEFAERLKEKGKSEFACCDGWVDFEDIDNILKELVGDK